MGIYKTSASFHIRESRGSQTAKPYFASFHQGERRGSQTAKPYTSRAWKALPYLRTRLWNVSPPTPSGGVLTSESFSDTTPIGETYLPFDRRNLPPIYGTFPPFGLWPRPPRGDCLQV